MSPLSSPAEPGKFDFDAYTYASPGLNYAGVPALAQYVGFDSPHPDFQTSQIDLSAFAELGFSVGWPFDNLNVPINGLLRVPKGRGHFPLVVFAHGNHDPFENSTPGYLYLCELLASHGIIAATIDVNFLNGWNFGENDGRAIVHLEHLKQFRTWNNTLGHRLSGKIDWNRVMIVGHSRGGEAVGHASAINRLSSFQPDVSSPIIPLDGSAGLGPYGFQLRLVAAIAPTDGQYQPLAGPVSVPDSYFLIHGSRDADVSTFEGYNTYGRTQRVDLNNPTISQGNFKSLLWVYRANHNQFNSVWAPEFGGPALSREAQEQVAKVQFGLLASALLLDRAEYLPALKDHHLAMEWMPDGVVLVSQYQDPSQYFLMHGQESISVPQVSLPVQGQVNLLNVVATRDFFDLPQAGAAPAAITNRVSWTTLGARWTLAMDPATLPGHQYTHLVLTLGQSTEGENQALLDQDLTIEVSSGTRTATVRCSSLQRLHYPDVFFNRGKTVLQSIRVPMTELIEQGILPSDIRAVALHFDQRPSGTMYIGNVSLSN